MLRAEQSYITQWDIIGFWYVELMVCTFVIQTLPFYCAYLDIVGFSAAKSPDSFVCVYQPTFEFLDSVGNAAGASVIHTNTNRVSIEFGHSCSLNFVTIRGQHSNMFGNCLILC